MSLVLVGLFPTLAQAVPVLSAPIPKCLSQSPVQMMKTSTAVFFGRAVEVNSSEETQVVRFSVTQSWKGIREREVTLTNFLHHEAPFFRPGNTYLVFAYNREGKLSTGACSGGGAIEYAYRAIRELNRWKAHRRSNRR